VKINDGPFLNFSGVIEEIDPAKASESDGERVRPEHAGGTRILESEKA